MVNYKKVIYTLVAGVLFASSVKITKERMVKEEPMSGSYTPPVILTVPPDYSGTNFNTMYYDTMPNQYSTLYSAPEPLNVSPNGDIVFAAFRRVETTPGSGWLALVYSTDGGSTWGVYPMINDQVGGGNAPNARYPHVGPFIHPDTFVVGWCGHPNDPNANGAWVATVIPSSGTAFGYWVSTPAFVGPYHFPENRNTLDVVNWLIWEDQVYQSHYWWRFGFIDPDPPNNPFGSAAVYAVDFHNGTYGVWTIQGGALRVYLSNDDGITWDSVDLDFTIPVETLIHNTPIDNHPVPDTHIIDGTHYINWWQGAFLNDGTPVALVPTISMLGSKDAYVYGSGDQDTLWYAQGLYLLTPTATYTVIEPDTIIDDNSMWFNNPELVIDKSTGRIYVFFIGMHTVDYVEQKRWGWTDVYYTYSDDGGATWAPFVNVTRNGGTDNVIENHLHVTKFLPGGSPWILFNTPLGWGPGGPDEGEDIFYHIFSPVGEAINTCFIMIGNVSVSVEEGIVFGKGSGINFALKNTVVRDGLLRFISDKTGSYSISLYNVTGRKVFTARGLAAKGLNIVDVSKLNEGIYFLKFDSGTGSTNAKVIIQR